MIPIALAALVTYGAWRWWRTSVRGPAYVPASKGDVMPRIAERFGVSVESIVAANGPGFARFYAPDGRVVPFKLPRGLKDAGPQEGAQGRYVP